MIWRQKIATTFNCSITALLTNRIVHQVLYVLIYFRCQRCDKDLNANHDSFVFAKTLFALHHCHFQYCECFLSKSPWVCHLKHKCV